MKSPAVQTVGYLAIFLPPSLIALGWYIDHHYLLPAFFFLVLPFSRTVFGSADDHSTDFSETQAQFLYHLPELFSLIAIPAVFSVPYFVHELGLHGTSLVWLSVSLLIAFGLASCVAHALIHQRGRQRRIGSLLASVCAYPWLQFEHFAHHASSRSTDTASAPRLRESALLFALRRLYLVPAAAFRLRHSEPGRRSIRSIVDDLYFHLFLTLATLIAFTLMAGFAGFFVYISTVLLMPLLISLVNYMQHWSLGDDLESHGKEVRHLSWDDDCQVLTWLTLDLNFHQNHHQNPNAAYFQRTGKYLGARMPISYGFAIIVMLFPPLWRRLMTPRLLQWLEQPDSLQSAGRRLFCFSTPATQPTSRSAA